MRRETVCKEENAESSGMERNPGVPHMIQLPGMGSQEVYLHTVYGPRAVTRNVLDPGATAGEAFVAGRRSPHGSVCPGNPTGREVPCQSGTTCGEAFHHVSPACCEVPRCGEMPQQGRQTCQAASREGCPTCRAEPPQPGGEMPPPWQACATRAASRRLFAGGRPPRTAPRRRPDTPLPPPPATTKDAGGKKIPRPPNAFMLFANECRRATARQFPHVTNKEVSVMLGRRWKAMDAREKQRYFEMAHAEDRRHKALYPGYVYSPQEARARKKLRMTAREGRRCGGHASNCQQGPSAGTSRGADLPSLTGDLAGARIVLERLSGGGEWIPCAPPREGLPAERGGGDDDDDDEDDDGLGQGDVLIFEDVETAREFLGFGGGGGACCRPCPARRRREPEPRELCGATPLSPDDLTRQVRSALHRAAAGLGLPPARAGVYASMADDA